MIVRKESKYKEIEPWKYSNYLFDSEICFEIQLKIK
jgi:hypothetical protein